MRSFCVGFASHALGFKDLAFDFWILTSKRCVCRSFVGLLDLTLSLLILRWFCRSCAGFVYIGLGFVDLSPVLYLLRWVIMFCVWYVEVALG